MTRLQRISAMTAQFHARFAGFPLLLFALMMAPLVGEGQVTVLLNDPGASYNNIDGTSTDIYGPVMTPDCGIVRFSVDFNIPTGWEGSGNMESSDECATCNGDPDNQSPDCVTTGAFINGCWDFLRVRFYIDGSVVYEELIGGPGTTNADQSGTITFDYCASAMAGQASVQVNTQTWASNETIEFSDVTITCIESTYSLTPIGPFCATDGPVALSSVQGGVSGAWSGPGVSGGQFNPANANLGSNTLLFTPNAGTCASPATLEVTVAPAVTPALPALGPFCSGDGPIVLSSPQSGVAGSWTVNGTPSGTFNPATAIVGNNTLVFTPNAGECANPATTTVVVQNSLSTGQPDLGTLCGSDPIVGLSTNGIPGMWMGTGVSGNNFNPGSVAPGNYTLTFMPAGGACAQMESIMVTVQADQPLMLSDLGDLCSDQGAVMLPSTGGVAGVWSGSPGIQGNQFNPALAGAGPFTLTFTPNAGQCAQAATISGDISPAVPLNLSAIGPFCESNANNISLPATNGVTGAWSSSGSGLVNGNTQFNPAAAGAGVAALTFTPDPGQCAEAEAISVTVESLTALSFSDMSPVCTTDPAINLNAMTMGVLGTWSVTGGGLTGSTFSPDQAGEGVYTISFTPAGSECATPGDFAIAVFETPDVPELADEVICGGGFTLPTLSGNANYYTQPGGQGTPLPAGSTVSTTGTIYIFEDNNTCTDESDFTLTVNQQPMLDEVDDVVSCGPFTLPPIGGVGLSGSEAYYTQPGGTGTALSPGQAVNTSQTVYIYDSSGPGCEDEVSFQVTINTPPVLTAQNSRSVCESFILPPIGGTGLSGGQAYYTGPNGTGTMLLPGTTLTQTTTLYIYDSTAPGCEDEVGPFTVTVRPRPILSPIPDATACGTYTFPPIQGQNLTPNAAYYDGPVGGGTAFFPGQIYNPGFAGPLTFTVYDESAPGCSDQETFTVTFALPPVLNPVDDIEVCGDFTLPEIQGFNLNTPAYYTSTFGMGFARFPGDEINSSALPLYIYDASAPGCFAQVSFNLEIFDPVQVEPIDDFIVCESFSFPFIEGQFLTENAGYFSEPGGQGTEYFPNQTINFEGTFYVYDSNGVCESEDEFSVTINATPTMTCSELQQASDDETADGIGQLVIVGGQPPFEVDYFSPSLGGGITSNDNTIEIPNLPPGTYIVQVEDANGCNINCSFTISSPGCLLGLDLLAQPASCPGVADGAINLTVTGGDGNYTYLWSNDAATPNLIGVPAGTYSVTVMDGTDCMGEAMVDVGTENLAPALAASPQTDSLCLDGCATYSLSFTGAPPFLAEL
ncbi:SprB repeat-containing protein [Phaeodactylibacter luteus]|uniref:HYR domain-containing protein n=1 Tax=Phaeodactylibacter luteus TaxID=1564516 RepID=A0A5C6RP79_9BACT|nr:SprB repeat-containing protein [Phaeodactylibacter luteus]TXB63470.1 hypothetical protein FRY97_08925 [Phaeodactylibacter luteus]